MNRFETISTFLFLEEIISILGLSNFLVSLFEASSTTPLVSSYIVYISIRPPPVYHNLYGAVRMGMYSIHMIQHTSPTFYYQHHHQIQTHRLTCLNKVNPIATSLLDLYCMAGCVDHSQRMLSWMFIEGLIASQLKLPSFVYTLFRGLLCFQVLYHTFIIVILILSYTT